MGNNSSSSPSPSSSTTSPTIVATPPQTSSYGASNPASTASSSGPQGSESPGAYTVPGQRHQRFTVTIPQGVRPEEHFAVIVNGQQMMVRCPPNNRAGDRLIVTLPRRQVQQYVVTVPPNVRPNEQFRVLIDNQEVMVTCPPGVRPNQRVSFSLPERPVQPAPNHHMYEVAVPPGVSPGQPFALIAGGQRVMVTCPPNVQPGQKIRFQLPVQLSQKQFEAIKVDYDMDGWMRCLGADLKFHWVYNSSSKTSQDVVEVHKIPFDVNSQAYVRELLPPTSPTDLGDLRFIEAPLYAMPTTVQKTQVNYQELSSVALLPFQQKCEWIRNQFTLLRVPWEDGHIKLKIRRSNILSDSIEGLESIQGEDMRKIFRFEFLGEPGLDAGGVAREWYNLISQQLFNPDLGLFLYSSANQMCMHINPNSGIANERHLKSFHFAGRILGKALMDGQIIPVHLVQPLYKHLMGYPIILRDLEHIDSEVYRSLLDLLDIDDVSMLYLDFSVTEDRLGLQLTIPLVPGGSDILVTNDNIVEYLKEQLKYRLLGRYKEQLREFLKGFYDVVPEPLLAVLNFQELELLLHGLPNIDLDDWQKHTDYTGDFVGNLDHKVIKWFWEIIRSYSQENRAKLLQFSTGTSGVPVQGFAFLQGNDGNIRRFTIHGDKNVKIFPRSHTCFNRIDMPIYSTKAEMQKYMTLAIQCESTGFGIE